ncbi:hypothetical protein, partial [Klebsiella pneumoniae]|uniref:hypothetical protein n=1 Tax=Klebsiella pneumoniae TaxID=573 RepID=UPI0027304D10
FARRVFKNVGIVDGLDRPLSDSVLTQPVPGLPKYPGIEFVPLIVVVVAQPQVAVQHAEAAIG